MKAIKLLSLIVGLMLFGTAINARGQETIEEAIQELESLRFPGDKIKENELRASAAMRIIMSRIRTTNPGGPVDPNLEDIDNQLEKIRNSNVSGDALIKWSWENRAGRCDEQVNLMKKILEAADVKVTIATSTLNHTFLVVNMAEDGDLDNPWAWGPNAFAPDTWVGKTLKGDEAWRHERYFGSGKGFVGPAAAPYSSRQYLQKYQELAEKNPDVIYRNCEKYNQMLKSYFKIPEEYRKQLDFRPKEDRAIEWGEEQLQEIRIKIRRLDKFDTEYARDVQKIHASLSELDGQFTSLARCSDDVKNFRNKISEMMSRLPQLRTEAGSGEISDVVPEDVVKNTGEVKVTQYFVFLLTNASNGLYVSSEDEIKPRTRCSFEGGGINCKPTDVVTYKKLLGPFASQEEAQLALCKSITETHFFPVGIGLKGRWQGSNTWYGLWDASVSNCPKQ